MRTLQEGAANAANAIAWRNGAVTTSTIAGPLSSGLGFLSLSSEAVTIDASSTTIFGPLKLADNDLEVDVIREANIGSCVTIADLLKLAALDVASLPTSYPGVADRVWKRSNGDGTYTLVVGDDGSAIE